ncbi:MAG TPA: carbohydrate kinase family protein [Candidatus Nanoarchaeia archaeon]|nr:carbohydrate kinase family protein [Candidatus Nanoarchaeia archaeon]
MQGFDVITVGSATADVFVHTNKKDVLEEKRRTGAVLACYPLGAKILIDRLEFLTGGGGTNTAVSFSRLGLKTAYLGNIGKDSNGEMIIDELKKEKVAFIGTRSRDKTDCSIILDSIEEDRTILNYKSASRNLEFRKIDKRNLSGKWYYFSALLGKAFGATVKLMAFAKKKGAMTAFNPSLYEVKLGIKKLAPMLKNTDVLIFNREEAAALLGRKGYAVPEEMLEKIRSLGPKIVVITDGKKGAICGDGIAHYSITPPKVRIVETTGAGDSFASAFVAALARKQDIRQALRIGIANAASVIQCHGAKNILLSWNAAQKDAARQKAAIREKASTHPDQ